MSDPPARFPTARETIRAYVYLILHSATVRNPRAKWEFPKGGVESGESTRRGGRARVPRRDVAVDWSFRDGFERTLSYTYIRRGRKVVKTVTYYIVEVRDPSPSGSFAGACRRSVRTMALAGEISKQISQLLYHTKIRQVFAEADAWLKG